MKLSLLTVGTNYAVVPSWGNNSSSARDITKVRENDVIKAELVGLDKYNYLPSRRSDRLDYFTLAPQGERSVGVIMKANDGTKDFYWTARLADIVEEWDKLTPVWSARNAEQEEKERAEREIRAKGEAIQKKAEEYVARLREVVPTSISEIVGRRCGFVHVEVNGYREKAVPVATINLADLETLLEFAFEGKAGA